LFDIIDGCGRDYILYINKKNGKAIYSKVVIGFTALKRQISIMGRGREGNMPLS
jgi:hypothetical protein